MNTFLSYGTFDIIDLFNSYYIKIITFGYHNDLLVQEHSIDLIFYEKMLLLTLKLMDLDLSFFIYDLIQLIYWKYVSNKVKLIFCIKKVK